MSVSDDPSSDSYDPPLWAVRWLNVIAAIGACGMAVTTAIIASTALTPINVAVLIFSVMMAFPLLTVLVFNLLTFTHRWHRIREADRKARMADEEAVRAEEEARASKTVLDAARELLHNGEAKQELDRLKEENKQKNERARAARAAAEKAKEAARRSKN